MTELLDRLIRYQTEVGVHRAGTCSAAPLERIEWYYSDYFKHRPIRSVETGCGASTVVMGTRSEHHSVYCYDDRKSANSSVLYAQQFDGFPHERVNWVFGPTQKTVLQTPLTEPVDLVLIDGPHGYPFPELEYFAFYRWVRAGGILIIDDIHIPTINNLYRILLQDDSWRSHGVSMATAYFQRTDAAAFNMEGDDWWLQRYNVQRFPAIRWDAPNEGYKLPLKFVYGDRTSGSAAPELVRGFSFNEGVPLAEGSVCAVEIEIVGTVTKYLELDVDLQPALAESRPDAGVSIVVDGVILETLKFADSARRTINVLFEIGQSGKLSIEFWNSGLIPAIDLLDWPKSAAYYDARLPGFWLHSLAIAERGSSAGRPELARARGAISNFHYDGQRFSFFSDDSSDSVQIFHSRGRFYEVDELEKLSSFVRPASRFLEIGAHIGNHTVFFEKVMLASSIVVIEPNDRARNLLDINCRLNSLTSVDSNYVSFALGDDDDSSGVMRTSERFNTGGATFVRDAAGPVILRRGDSLFPSRDFDVVKIDVEGMELLVLKGLLNLIRRCAPLIFVEITQVNQEQFLNFLTEVKYKVVWEGSMYDGLVNYILRPTEAPISGPLV